MGEDLDMGRLYFPKEIIGENISDLKQILEDKNIGEKREKLAALTYLYFKEAENFLKTADTNILKPAIVMMQVYYNIFKEMEKRGWDKINPRVKLSKFKMLRIALWPKSTL
ncbi:MAG: Squalene/phytoene synthase [Alphaproteobacteria bacterium ADurb.Bin438]|nr:MAG: Squalene/phytoene synthase [Alphaproteobacteria bacterium ADurb.Bin438]